MTNYIYNANNFESAVSVKDYPWGFRLKTERKYWTETVPQKGDRFCFQTLNPKTGQWCKVKKSIYYDVIVMTENDGQISYMAFDWKSFLKNDLDYEKLNAEQKKQLCKTKAFDDVMANVEITFTKGPVSEEKEKEQKETERKIINAINQKTITCWKQQDLI